MLEVGIQICFIRISIDRRIFVYLLSKIFPFFVPCPQMTKSPQGGKSFLDEPHREVRVIHSQLFYHAVYYVVYTWTVIQILQEWFSN